MNLPNKVSLLSLNVEVPAGERWDLGCLVCPNWRSYSKSASYTNLVIAVLQIFLSASLTCLPLNPWMLTPSSPMQNAQVAELLLWRITTQKVRLFKVSFGRTCLIGGARAPGHHQPLTRQPLLLLFTSSQLKNVLATYSFVYPQHSAPCLVPGWLGGTAKECLTRHCGQGGFMKSFTVALEF